MYKHIVFDFDGTIADSAEVALEVYNKLAKEYNYKTLTMDVYRKLSTLTINERFKVIGVPYYKPWVILKLIKRAKEEYSKLLNSIDLFDGMEDVLLKLKHKGYKLAIVSTNSKENIIDFLEDKKIDCIDEVYSSKGLYGKVEVIKSYLKDNNINKDELLYVADELRDLKVCKKVGVDILSVTWGFDSEILLKEYKPTYIVSKVEEILRLI